MPACLWCLGPVGYFLNGNARKFCQVICSKRSGTAAARARARSTGPVLRAGTCFRCGAGIRLGQTSAKQGKARCRDCIGTPIPPPAWVPSTLVCQECLTPFVQNRAHQVYCSTTCANRRRYRHGSGGRKSPTDRGVGYLHAKARAAAALLHQDTDPCSLCELVLGPMGPWLHYDHTEDRTAYRGFAHAVCNVLDGAHRGGQATRRKVLARSGLVDSWHAKQLP